MRATEIASLLAREVERVAAKLLPDGKRKGAEWVCGDIDGSAGDSLKLRVSGDKAGVWSDFATGESGDLIGLWMQTQNCDLPTACKDAMDFLGVREAKVENPRRQWSKPSREGVSSLPPQGLEWLRVVRKLSPEAVAAYKLAYRKGALMFPYLRDGELVFAKYRAIPEKKFWTDADCEPSLFGWQAIPRDARTVIVVEGELDALAMYDYGMPALSVPFGGGDKDKQAWIEHEFDRLSCFDEIVLCMDADKAGEQAVAEIVKRLGRERCRVAKLPRKDANQCLIDGVPPAEVQKAIREARSLDPENLRSAADYEDLVWQEFAQRAGGEVGIRLPWDKCRESVVLRQGETSLWAGINGHGKSQIIGHVAVEAIQADYKVCVASLEFLPQKMLRRLQVQQTGTRSPSESQSRMLSRYWRDRLWVFDPGTKQKSDVLLETMGYAVKRYGIDLFVIDNLAKLGIAEDEYATQAAFVDRLTDFSRTYNTHCALIHHVKKTDRGENSPPEKGDVKGSGGITDLVDSVFTIWRNKPKEKRVRENRGEDTHETAGQPDAILTCHKQRNGDAEPTVWLWFDPSSFRYHDKPFDAQRDGWAEAV